MTKIDENKFTYKKILREKNSEDAETVSGYYVTNSDLLPEVIKCKATGVISNKLAVMLSKIANKYASKPGFAMYTYREDMVASALADLCSNALKFDAVNYSNPFSFYTSCVHNSFLGYLTAETKQRRIRDQLLVDLGENPSFGFQDEYKNSMGDDESRSSMDDLKNDIAGARERLEKDRLKALDKLAQKANALGLLDFEDTEILEVKSALYLEDSLDLPKNSIDDEA